MPSRWGPPHGGSSPPQGPEIIRQTMLATAAAVAVLSGALAFWYLRGVVLIVFSAALLAVFLDGLIRGVQRIAPFPRQFVLALICAAIGSGLFVTGIEVGPLVLAQVRELVSDLGQRAADLYRLVVGPTGEIGSTQLQADDLLRLLPSPWGFASGAAALLGTTFATITALFVIAVTGIYLAADPGRYARLAESMLPVPKREWLHTMLLEMGYVLRRWLIGQSLSMIVIGGTSYLGLLVLGVPLALVLAVFAGVVAFIPYLGPIIGAVPMIVVATGEGWTLALWVTGLYAAIQLFESYVLSPLVQSRAVDLAPPLIITNQLSLGLLLGIPGLVLATPLAAIAVVAFRNVGVNSERQSSR